MTELVLRDAYLMPAMGALTMTNLGTFKIEMFNEIPIKEMRADSLTELDLKGKGVGRGCPWAQLMDMMGIRPARLHRDNCLRNSEKDTDESGEEESAAC